MNLTQADLADVLGVSFQQIQKYENGKNRVNANRLVLIASALNVRTEDFFPSDTTADNAISLIDVNDKNTVRMLRAYSRISDQATQRQMVALIETIADAAEHL